MCDLHGCGDDTKNLPLPPVAAADRRAFLAGLAALPLATVLAYPDLARAAAGTTTDITVPTPSGGTAMGALALPKGDGKAPAVLLIHEWWGLNDQIKAVAAELAELGYIALAVDLYGGKYGSTPQEAKALMQGLDPKAATEQLVTLVGWLKGHERSTGKVGTMGWCFGGGWSLNASLATKVDATVIYYGRVTKSAADLASLSSPVLGHFGTLDKSINPKMVGEFEAAMAEAGKTDLTVHWYTANHAFANPTGSRYDADDAALAWARTRTFLRKNLG